MSGGPSIGLSKYTKGVTDMVYLHFPPTRMIKSFIIYQEEAQALRLMQIMSDDNNRKVTINQSLTEAQFRGLVWRLRKANGKCGEASSREINNQQEK